MRTVAPTIGTPGHDRGEDVDPEYYCACGLPWLQHADPPEAPPVRCAGCGVQLDSPNRPRDPWYCGDCQDRGNAPGDDHAR